MTEDGAGADPTTASVRAKLLQSFLRWAPPTSPQASTSLGWRLDRLASLPTTAEYRRRNPAFIEIGRAAAEKERDGLASALEHAADLLTAIHAPVVRALAKVGVLKTGAADLRATARRIRSADLLGVPARPPRGRPRDRVALVTARLVRDDFEALTGKRAARQNWIDEELGPFVNLLGEVYAALNIRANPDSQARVVCGEKTP